MKAMQKTVIVSSLLVVTSVASAAESPVSGNVALTSNYVWRGYSQTAEDPAIQGGFDYAHDSGFYVGFWGSNVNFGDVGPVSSHERAQLEADLYAGFKFKAGIDWDVGVLNYSYPGADSSFDYDFTELYVGGSWEWLSAKYSYASDYQGPTDKEGSYLEANASFTLPGDIGLGLHVGSSSGDGVKAAFGDTYTDYKISVSKEFFGLGFSLAYTDTSGAPEIKSGVGANDGMVILTVSKAM